MIENDHAEELFDVVRAADIPGEVVSESWLIEDLWSRAAVGWVAGAPKSLKSWTALDMAVSVATGTACLGRFRVEERGRALIYLAEDSLPAVRERLEALARARQLTIDELDVHVITASSMRLDLGRDQVRLQKTVRALSPKILVLDPLVRIHRADENSSGEVSSLLGYLRELQREFHTAVVVVHHVRKSAAPSQAAGQGLRGSGDLHAWSDSALYLRRKGDHVIISVEHRAASAPPAVTLRLADDEYPMLEVVEETTLGHERQRPVEDRVLSLLAQVSPMTRSRLRAELGVKNERLGHVLERLAARRAVERTPGGWRLVDPESPDRSLGSPIGMRGNGTVPGPEDATT